MIIAHVSRSIHVKVLIFFLVIRHQIIGTGFLFLADDFFDPPPFFGEPWIYQWL